MFLKKIKNNTFSNVFFKVNFYLNRKYSNNLILNIINPDNFKINTNFCVSQKTYKLQKNLQFKKIKDFIKIFDVYGELKSKNWFR